MTIFQISIATYMLIAFLIAWGFQGSLTDEDLANRQMMPIVLTFCIFWPLIPAFVAAMRWDMRRHGQK